MRKRPAFITLRKKIMVKEKDPEVGNLYYTKDEADELFLLKPLKQLLIKLNTHYTESGINNSAIDIVKHLKANEHTPILNAVIKRLQDIDSAALERFKKLNA